MSRIVAAFTDWRALAAFTLLGLTFGLVTDLPMLVVAACAEAFLTGARWVTQMPGRDPDGGRLAPSDEQGIWQGPPGTPHPVSERAPGAANTGGPPPEAEPE